MLLCVWLINSMFGFHRIYIFLEFLNNGLKFHIFHQSPLDCSLHRLIILVIMFLEIGVTAVTTALCKIHQKMDMILGGVATGKEH